MMLSLVAAPTLVQTCSVCELPVNNDPKMVEWLTDKSRTPMDKLEVLVASGCCPLCGNSVAVDTQTPDEYIGRYISFLQGGSRG